MFLDEPTVGLDVEARRAFWAVIGEKAAQGRSVLLTTHYLEEADALADRIVLIDRGRVDRRGDPGRDQGARRRPQGPLPHGAAAGRGGRDARRARRPPGRRADRAVRGGGRARHPRAAARDPGLSALEVRGADLEEAFLALTGSDEKEEVAA